MKLTGIYGFINKVNGKWYVGQSRDIHKRWNNYRLLRCKSQTKWYNALLKYGYDGFTPSILEECSPEMLPEREAFWVVEKDSVENGYNCRTGGFVGWTHSEETKQKLRLANLGKKHSEATKAKQRLYRASDEAKAKISESLLGNQRRTGIPHTEETKVKMSAFQKGRPKSAEHRARIAAAHIGISIPHTEEARRKISEASKAMWAKRKASQQLT